jgi:hypothetical protein
VVQERFVRGSATTAAYLVDKAPNNVRPLTHFSSSIPRRSSMAKYLISFPSAAMVVPDGEWEAVGRDAHPVIDQAKAAGVYVFGGVLTKTCRPHSSQPTARLLRVATHGRPRSTTASPCSNCLRARRPLRGPLVSQKPAAATRICASLGSTHSPESGVCAGIAFAPVGGF